MTPEKDETAPRLCECGHTETAHDGGEGGYCLICPGYQCITFDPAPAPGPGASEGEVAWLIERGQAVNHAPTIWWKGGDMRPINDWSDCWTTVAWDARRFRTKEAATVLSERLFGLGMPGSKPSVAVVEHVFVPAPVPPPVGAEGKGGLERERFIEYVLRAVAELPDRTSPDDWPEAMLVTTDELEHILRNALEVNR